MQTLTSHAALSLSTDTVVAPMFSRAGRIHLSSADDIGGRWITIGASHGSNEHGEEEEAHGGAHVFIRDGKIEKGPKSLAGKTIGQLKSKAGQSKIGGKGTPMDRTREKLRKLNEGGAPEHKGKTPEAKAIAEKLNAAIGHAPGPEVEKQVNAQREAQRAAGEAEGRAKAAVAKSSAASRTPEFHARVRELRGQGLDTARAVARARGELESKNPSLKAEPVAPKAVRPAMKGESANVVKQTNASEHTEPTAQGEQTPATDFHERVKQLRASGRSMTGAVVQARSESVDRAMKAAKAVPTENANPVQELDKARAAHAAGDTAAVQKHVAAAVEKTAKGGKPAAPSKAALQQELVQHWKDQGHGSTAQDDKELSGHAYPYTFKRDPRTASGLPKEVETYLEGRAQLKARKLFNVTGDASKANGADAMGELGEAKYFGLIDKRMAGETRQALEHARQSPDPEIRFKAAVHDTMLPKGERAAHESLDPSSLHVGEEFTINKIPVEVTENEDGEKFLRDHGDLPETPVDAIRGKLAVDKGTRHEKELKSAGDDFFDDVKDEPKTAPEMKSAKGKQAATEPESQSLREQSAAIKTIDRIGSIVTARKAEWTATHPTIEYVPFDTDFLTDEERGELHEAKMQLPSTGELIQQASERLKAKRAKIRQAFADSLEKPATNEPQPEMKSVVGKASSADVDTSRQLGMFAKDASGNPIEVGEHAGQANLFNPSKFKSAEKPADEKVKPQFDPKHTAEMFPAEGMKSQAGKSIPNPAHDAPGNKATEAAPSRAKAQHEASAAANARTRRTEHGGPDEHSPDAHEAAATAHEHAAKMYGTPETDATGAPVTVEGERQLSHKAQAIQHRQSAAELRADRPYAAMTDQQVESLYHARNAAHVAKPTHSGHEELRRIDKEIQTRKAAKGDATAKAILQSYASDAPGQPPAMQSRSGRQLSTGQIAGVAMEHAVVESKMRAAQNNIGPKVRSRAAQLIASGHKTGDVIRQARKEIVGFCRLYAATRATVPIMQSRAARNLPRMMHSLIMLSADAGDGHWVTIDGTHVFIGKGGEIAKGPAALVGKKPDHIDEHHREHTDPEKPPIKKPTAENPVIKRQMVNLESLNKTEHTQQEAAVKQLQKQIGTDPEDLVWDDQPALIADENGNLLDGHHRHEAASRNGLKQWPTILVNRDEWDKRANRSHQHAAKWAADEADDAVTWGSL